MNSDTSPEEITDVVDLYVVRRKFQAILNGEEDARNRTVQQAISEIGSPSSREAFNEWFASLESEESQLIADVLKKGQKEEILEKRKYKIPHFESTDYKEAHKVRDDISLSEATYYDSYFKFSNGSMSIFSVIEMDPILKTVSKEASDKEEAQSMFRELIQEHDYPRDYRKAAREIPLPLVGGLENNPRPRIVRFEDPRHLYVELWSFGKEKNVYHPEQGETLSFQSRAKSQIRIHIDRGLIEYTSTRDTKAHEETDMSHIESIFSFDGELRTDGGSQGRFATLTDEDITSEDIWNVIQNIGVFSTLESFEAKNATISYSSVNKRDVKKGPSRDDIKRDTKLRRANVQILIEDPADKCEFIEPEYIFEEHDFDDDDNIEQVIQELTDKEGYNELTPFTISIHAKNDTIQIDKESCQPSTRAKVFDHVMDQLE
ncbi:hypothetical protein [Haloterrigena alkaliphila]|uniref:Uncharacterized protein n=1 Tax=Haloterrigena alkaliphila TaxID=2816475 RepID=A0A8A2VHR6_9EURY|nr:hypothetical protein [Haloterrigena alkaliphila]QSX00887.1 hypothetical protein J0X25_07990 [Haloterrigena alkaliphila]